MRTSEFADRINDLTGRDPFPRNAYIYGKSVKNDNPVVCESHVDMQLIEISKKVESQYEVNPEGKRLFPYYLITPKLLELVNEYASTPIDDRKEKSIDEIMWERKKMREEMTRKLLLPPLYDDNDDQFNKINQRLDKIEYKLSKLKPKWWK